MSLYYTIKKALTDTVDVVIDKTTTQAQKSRLRIVMKNEAKLTNDAYIELGKYLYENCRENAAEDIESICRRIDISKDRMKRAQEKYREVLQEELVNREITKNEVKESLQKMKEPIVTKAKDTADKVCEFKDAAKIKATELKEKMPTVNVGYGEINSEEAATDKEQSENTAKVVSDTVINNGDEISVKDATENPVNFSVSNSSADRSVPEKEKSDKEASVEIYSYSTASPSETDAAESAPETETQEFQRTMAVDILTEEDDEDDIPVIKPYSAPTALDKAKKLKEIIVDNSEIADPND